FAQLGWLKKLVAVRSARSRMLSPREKLLPKPTSTMCDPGPMITPLAELPKKPGVGAANAVGSNQRVVGRSSDGEFGCREWVGRVGEGQGWGQQLTRVVLVDRRDVPAAGDSPDDRMGVRKVTLSPTEGKLVNQVTRGPVGRNIEPDGTLATAVIR